MAGVFRTRRAREDLQELLGRKRQRGEASTISSSIAAGSHESTASRMENRVGGSSLPGLRWDAPSRNGYRQGRMPDLQQESQRQVAMHHLEMGVYAESTRPTVESRLRTIHAMLKQWNLVLLPLTVHKIKALAASLKAGNYRSAALYLSTAKIEAERAGCHVTPSISRAIADAVRSCERGMGPPKKALA